MEKMTAGEITGAVKGRLAGGDPGMQFTCVSTDTRSIKKGDLFIALKGKNFDAHDFVPKAIKMGAGGVIVNYSSKLPSSLKLRRTGKAQSSKVKSINEQRVTRNEEPVVITVKDTLRAMQDLAAHYRRKFRILLVGVTGSNGKTTTKEMTWNILARKFGEKRVLKNTGNLNNGIGVPLTLFRLNALHRAAVLEMGTNAPGEIRRLAEIAGPGTGVITNIGISHTRGLKSLAGVAKEKFSLIACLPRKGTAVLNLDDGVVRGMIKRKGLPRSLRMVTYGIKNRGDIRAEGIELTSAGSRFRIRTRKGSFAAEIKMPGFFNISNALAAASAGLSAGASPGMVKNGLKKTTGIPMRMETRKIKGVTLINDAYNANPSSVREALSFIRGLGAGRKIVAMGDMLELGKMSVPCHREIAGDMIRAGVDILFTAGPLARLTAGSFRAKGGRAFSSASAKQLAGKLLPEVRRGDVILVKGSRKARMEEVINAVSSALSAL